MTSEAQKKATKRYIKKTYDNVLVRLHKGKDADIISYLDTQQSKQGAIKAAIREKIEK